MEGMDAGGGPHAAQHLPAVSGAAVAQRAVSDSGIYGFEYIGAVFCRHA